MATASVETEVVMTLVEAAAFLRVPEDAVLRAMADHGLEARQIEGEWRFLKSAIEDWLCHRSPVLPSPTTPRWTLAPPKILSAFQT